MSRLHPYSLERTTPTAAFRGSVLTASFASFGVVDRGTNCVRPVLHDSVQNDAPLDEEGACFGSQMFSEKAARPARAIVDILLSPVRSLLVSSDDIG